MDKIMMDSNKCKICQHYLFGIGRCKFCNFQFDDSLPWCNDADFDIFDIDSDVEWDFLQIQYRLKSKGIDVLQVLTWCDDNCIVLIGTRAYPDKVAKALGVSEDCIVSDSDVGIMVVNLFKGKALRLRDENGEDTIIAELLADLN